MEIALLPDDIKYKICQYFIELQLISLKEKGWFDVNEEIIIYKMDKEQWHKRMRLYKIMRWRKAGFIVCDNPVLHNRAISIDKSRIRPCKCGNMNPPIPYICRLKDCKCGNAKSVSIKEFDCLICGANPKKLWTMPL